jgi:hypothetical protein
MWRIVKADWRVLSLIVLGGWAMAFLIIGLIYRGLADDCCLNDPQKRLYVLKYFLITLAYGQSAAVLWAQSGGHHIYRRHKLLATLPLSQRELNLVLFLTGAVLLAAGAPAWIAVFYSWKSLELSFEPWFAVVTLLGIVGFILLSTRNLFPRVLIPIIFPFIFIPGTENLLRVPLEFMTTPEASIICVVATVLFGLWVVKRPTPSWAPGWGRPSGLRIPLWRSRRV